LHTLNWPIVILTTSLACGSSIAQQPGSATTGEAVGVAVHLEPHLGQTKFQIGDPIILDLVFTSRSPGYIAATDQNFFFPPHDQVDIAPSSGWVRTHDSVLQQTCCNETSTLDSEPVYVPVLLNRTITFLQPGHYTVTVTTARMGTLITLGEVNPVTTNSVAIDVSAREDTDQDAEVAALSGRLEKMEGDRPRTPLPPEIKDELDRAIAKEPDNSIEAAAKAKDLLQKLAAFDTKEDAADKQWSDARREVALRLACLDGDDAVRAKVHFIAEETQARGGDPNTIVWIMIYGLFNSRNKLLQLTVVEEAWRDPKLLPTYELQTALRQAKELTQRDSVTDESVIWAPAHHDATFAEYQREINEIITTLPLRSESNRAETIKYLKALGAPNPFNRAGSSNRLSK
jgi:hypothetical protein